MERTRASGARLLILVAITGVFGCANEVTSAAGESGIWKNFWTFIADESPSFFGGIIGGALLWYATFHVFVPKIGFSRYLKKPHYEIRIVNTGKRGALDVNIFARLTFESSRKNVELLSA
jgi:hypothetical protein